MSGTSLDGIDLSYVEFNHVHSWGFNIIKSETISYTRDWYNILKNLTDNSIQKLKSIDEKYTMLLAKTVNSFIEKNNIKKIDAVCSHGHTALHEPDKKLTYQIGNQEQLASLIGQTVVCDFRIQDVEFGGEGAPLVPIGDKLLFSDYKFCLNLGGFANVSTENNGKRIAYDICAVNIVLNNYVGKLGVNFDDKGKISASGNVNEELLTELNEIEFYGLKSPKSLGIEWVRKTIFPIIDKYNLSVKDILRTFVEHAAYQIGLELNKTKNISVLITGGGVYNLFLVERLKDFTSNKIIIPSKQLIEYKEALIFGFLGVLKLREENNCLSSVTGSFKDHSSGNIYYP